MFTYTLLHPWLQVVSMCNFQQRISHEAAWKLRGVLLNM